MGTTKKSVAYADLYFVCHAYFLMLKYSQLSNKLRTSEVEVLE